MRPLFLFLLHRLHGPPQKVCEHEQFKIRLKVHSWLVFLNSITVQHQTSLSYAQRVYNNLTDSFTISQKAYSQFSDILISLSFFFNIGHINIRVRVYPCYIHSWKSSELLLDFFFRLLKISKVVQLSLFFFPFSSSCQAFKTDVNSIKCCFKMNRGGFMRADGTLLYAARSTSIVHTVVPTWLKAPLGKKHLIHLLAFLKHLHADPFL